MGALHSAMVGKTFAFDLFTFNNHNFCDKRQFCYIKGHKKVDPINNKLNFEDWFY